MVKLTENQIKDKIKFINNYINAENAATGSKFDQNANVSTKNMATLSSELYKDYNIQLNRHLVSEKLKELYSEEVAKEFNRQLENHEIYVNDETSLLPYCAAITLYPFLISGLKGHWFESICVHHLKINFILMFL